MSFPCIFLLLLICVLESQIMDIAREVLQTYLMTEAIYREHPVREYMQGTHSKKS